jgi:UDP-N-acetylglucosamine 4,6-dehydratase
MIADKTVLITGGAGSVGRILVRQLLNRTAEVIRVFDQSEPGLAELKSQVNAEKCRFFVGNVRDKDRLARAMNGVDIVIHTAAMKHVDISEYNPFEAVKTNVIGLQNVIDAAIDADVERFVFTSSDKAAHPANTMGTTKLLGEKLVTAANKYSGGHDIRLCSVRFGNVINSSQSVIPIFKRQIETGGPVTLTDPQMSRFFLTYNDVTELVIDAMKHTEAGEIFIQKMDAIAIEDLAEAMIDVFAPAYDHQPAKIDIEETGRRVGETLDEKILTQREVHRTVENDSLYAILPEQSEGDDYLNHSTLGGFDPVETVVRSSEHADKLSQPDIRHLLQSEFAGVIA